MSALYLTRTENAAACASVACKHIRNLNPTNVHVFPMMTNGFTITVEQLNN